MLGIFWPSLYIYRETTFKSVSKDLCTYLSVMISEPASRVRPIRGKKLAYNL